MWNSFRNWYIYNQDQITWFVIGWMMFAGIDSLARGNYIWALIDFALVYVNYKFSKVRM